MNHIYHACITKDHNSIHGKCTKWKQWLCDSQGSYSRQIHKVQQVHQFIFSTLFLPICQLCTDVQRGKCTGTIRHECQGMYLLIEKPWTQEVTFSLVCSSSKRSTCLYRQQKGFFRVCVSRQNFYLKMCKVNTNMWVRTVGEDAPGGEMQCPAWLGVVFVFHQSELQPLRRSVRALKVGDKYTQPIQFMGNTHLPRCNNLL